MKGILRLIIYLLVYSILVFSCTNTPLLRGMTDEEILASVDTFDIQSPRLSPDGQWILFRTSKSGQKQLAKCRIDGSEYQELYQTSGYLCCQNFSRDGKYITFNGSDGDLEVFKMNANGSQLEQITNNEIHDGGALWTYDNQKLILTSVHNGDFNLAGIYSMDPNGIDKTRIHTIEFRAFDPSISHDGKNILVQHVENKNLNIYNIDVFTGEPTQMTESDSADWYPEWAPNDELIAYRNNESGDWDIYVMDAKGQNKRKLTDSPMEDRVPVWSPDGKYIAYQSKGPEELGFDIWVMKSDGSEKRNLTNDQFDNHDPVWSPDGQLLIYNSKIGDTWQIMSIQFDGYRKSLIQLSGPDTNEEQTN